MIELAILNYLTEQLGVPVYMVMPSNAPTTCVLLEKTAGGEEDGIGTATLAIQSYGRTMEETAYLNHKVCVAMRDAVTLDIVARCDHNSDYNYPDTTRKRYRYQAVFDLTWYYDD